MAKNIIFILTEGDHDSAFIYRIIKSYGGVTDAKVIKTYPFPLNDLFVNGISNISIEELNIQEAASRFLPYKVMNQGQNIFLLYTIGGDAQAAKRASLLKVVNSFNAKDDDAIQVVKDTMFSVLFFFDADDHGVRARVNQIRVELNSTFDKEILDESFENKNIYAVENLKVGVFVFAEDGKEIGMLEDILIPLMRQGNDDIFEAADTFLSIHEQTTLFKGKLKMDNDVIKKVNGQKYSYRKSLVGTVGQLQKSGKSNTVCISDADYLNDSKIQENNTCIDIYQFITKAMV